MKNIKVVVFGSLDHDYPVLEIYSGDELIIEIVTEDPKTNVSALVSDSTVSYTDLAKLIEKILPIWFESIIERQAARSFISDNAVSLE